MSLPHALLTALIERPCSGLELARRFDKSIGYFWQATHQQIYKELARIEGAGWVCSTAESGRGRKRHYHVLPEGKEELRRWTQMQQDPQPLRDALMVRLRAEASLGQGDVYQDLFHRRTMHQEKLALYRRIESKDFLGRSLDRESQLQYLVLQGGMMHESQWLEFCERALQVLAANTQHHPDDVVE